MNNIKVNFLGGLEHLFGSVNELSVNASDYHILSDLIKDLAVNHIKQSPDLFNDDGFLAPGILALINDCDIFTLDAENSPITSGDTVTFISTIHGG